MGFQLNLKPLLIYRLRVNDLIAFESTEAKPPEHDTVMCTLYTFGKQTTRGVDARDGYYKTVCMVTFVDFSCDNGVDVLACFLFTFINLLL